MDLWRRLYQAKIMSNSAAMTTMITIQKTVLKSHGTVTVAAAERVEVTPKLSVTVAAILKVPAEAAE
jgi:hypothetical protein